MFGRIVLYLVGVACIAGGVWAMYVYSGYEDQVAPQVVMAGIVLLVGVTLVGLAAGLGRREVVHEKERIEEHHHHHTGPIVGGVEYVRPPAPASTGATPAPGPRAPAGQPPATRAPGPAPQLPPAAAARPATGAYAPAPAPPYEHVEEEHHQLRVAPGGDGSDQPTREQRHPRRKVERRSGPAAAETDE